MGKTIRIRTKNLDVCELTGNSWRKSNVKLPDAFQVIRLFRSHGNFGMLIDKKNPEFLKGQLSAEGIPQGARIDVLPDGRKLDKAYSLFADHLTVHDESSNSHWDVIYRNKGGTYSYVYTLEKKERFIRKKYRAVEEFEKVYQKLKHKVCHALNDKKDFLALPMYTLLNTYMRVGNEIYYKAHGHKGLTTLNKGNVLVKGNDVTFNYLAKNGVPMRITREFPDAYIHRLQDALRHAKSSSFIFTNSHGSPLSDTHFKKAFRRYCGREFYPHIVRSYYATNKAKEFLKRHRSATKKQVRAFFLEIADTLGHKRFVKKKNSWEDNYTVTVNHYIEPKLVTRIKSLVS